MSKLENTENLFEKINEINDFYFISFLVLFLLKDKEEYSTLSELTFLLDKDDFIKFLRYFEGQTLEIPTTGELEEVIQVILAYYYYDIKDYDWDQLFIKLNIEHTNKNANWLRGKLIWLRKVIDDVRIPEKFYRK